MVESMESIKTAAVHADARAELANLLDKASEELAAGLVFYWVAYLIYKVFPEEMGGTCWSLWHILLVLFCFCLNVSFKIMYSLFLYIYILYIKDTLIIESQTLSIRSNDWNQPLSRNANNYQRPPSCRCNIPIHVSRVHTARFNWSCSTLSIVSTRKSNNNKT